MGHGDKFQRDFMFFVQEDAGYGNGRNPSGYMKIEVKDGKGILSTLVQDMKEGASIPGYRLYLIKPGDNGMIPVDMGAIPIVKGRGELKLPFSPYDVASTGKSIDEFTIAAVLVDFMEAGNNVICPLAAYKGKKVRWKNEFERYLISQKSKQRIPEELKNIEKAEVSSKFAGTFESKSNIPENNPQLNIPDLSRERDSDNTQENDLYAEQKDIGITEFNNTDDLYENMELTDANEEKVQTVNNSDPCANCKLGFCSKAPLRKEVTEKNVAESLKEKFNMHFEKCDPFNSKRKDYYWWKLGNINYLNTIMSQFNIRMPALDQM
jgi:hypothetical protein